ncbi:unnamed protein product [Leptidea sinapis]|uniref:Uncharacterized protein n=1 Tax=Leptidea sinapis TaxID=189913 RepID=A0A5E4PZJ8_9NEOP|nr:unnamed protein product [Leptidea sinapis]
MFIALRFYATGTCQVVIGDDINVHKTTVSGVVHKVSKEIAKLGRSYISMPNYEDTRDVKAQFLKIAGFSNMDQTYQFNPLEVSKQSYLEIEKDSFLLMYELYVMQAYISVIWMLDGMDLT